MTSSLELAYQLRRLSMESCSSGYSTASDVPPPASLSSASYSTASASPQEFDFDCSGFAGGISPTPSYASSGFSSLSSANTQGSSNGGGLSRSRVCQNLSALGGAAYEDSTRLTHASGPNEGWGYFVDTPSR